MCVTLIDLLISVYTVLLDAVLYLWLLAMIYIYITIMILAPRIMSLRE